MTQPDNTPETQMVPADLLKSMWDSPEAAGLTHDNERELVIVTMRDGAAYATTRLEWEGWHALADRSSMTTNFGTFVRDVADILEADPAQFADPRPAGSTLTIRPQGGTSLHDLIVILGEDIPASTPTEVRADGKLYAVGSSLVDRYAAAVEAKVLDAIIGAEVPAPWSDPAHDIVGDITAAVAAVEKAAEVHDLDTLEDIDAAIAYHLEVLQVLGGRFHAELLVKLIRLRDLVAANETLPTDPLDDPTSSALAEVAEAVAEPVDPEQRVAELAAHLAEYDVHGDEPEAWIRTARSALEWLEGEDR